MSSNYFVNLTEFLSTQNLVCGEVEFARGSWQHLAFWPCDYRNVLNHAIINFLEGDLTMADKDIQIRKNSTPSADVYNPWTDMNRLIERVLNDPFGSLLNEMPSLSRRTLTDIKETDEGYILRAEIPGIPKEDVDISVNGNTLTISAEHREEEGKEDSGQGYRRQYRSFHQSFSLPSMIDANKIEANCENGMLEIYLPKTESAQPKKVQVQSGKGSFLDRLTGKKDVSQNKEQKQEKH
jgi:HSP20 family protein